MPTVKEVARELVMQKNREVMLPLPVYGGGFGSGAMYRYEHIKPFIIAQTERDGRKFYVVKTFLRNEIGYVDDTDVSYRLMAEPRMESAPEVPDPDLILWKRTLYEDVGHINFVVFRDVPVARIYSVNLVEEFQHKGLGTFMYKTAINDLVGQGKRVQSDSVRSPQANRLWFNLKERNPDSVKVLPNAGGPSGVFEARGIVHRRPNVKRHQRRRA